MLKRTADRAGFPVGQPRRQQGGLLLFPAFLQPGQPFPLLFPAGPGGGRPGGRRLQPGFLRAKLSLALLKLLSIFRNRFPLIQRRLAAADFGGQRQQLRFPALQFVEFFLHRRHGGCGLSQLFGGFRRPAAATAGFQQRLGQGLAALRHFLQTVFFLHHPCQFALTPLNGFPFPCGGFTTGDCCLPFLGGALPTRRRRLPILEPFLGDGHRAVRFRRPQGLSQLGPFRVDGRDIRLQ